MKEFLKKYGTHAASMVIHPVAEELRFRSEDAAELEGAKMLELAGEASAVARDLQDAMENFSGGTRAAYKCFGPFTRGKGGKVCVHGWSCGHSLSADEAARTDALTNAGLIPRQSIEPIE